jgi:SAM-dependent methyltransferase
VSAAGTRSLLHLAPLTARLFAFSLRTAAYKGFADWNICYERVFEYGETYALLERERPESVLDVAGDISLFGCFVADELECRVDIVDMGDLDYCRGLRERMDPEAAQRIGLIPRTRAEDLPLDSGYDVITCISSIEHFAGDADLRFVESAARLLADGGLMIITAPFTLAEETERRYRKQNYYAGHGEEQDDGDFYMRFYSRSGIDALAERSGLRVERLLFGGERVNFCDRVFLYGPKNGESGPTKADVARGVASRAIRALSPVYPFLTMREAERPEPFTVGPRREKLTNPDTFLLALRKPPATGAA